VNLQEQGGGGGGGVSFLRMRGKADVTSLQKKIPENLESPKEEN